MNDDSLKKVLFGKPERIYTNYKNNDGVLTDPTSPHVDIYDPSGILYDSGTPTKFSTGVYYYEVTLSTASTQQEGIYQAYWQGIVGGEFVTMDVPQYFYGMRIPWQMTQPSNIIQSIRRMIGDTNPNNYRISNLDLYYFLSDAVDDVQAEFNMGYILTITPTSVTWNHDLTTIALALFKMRTLILVLESTMNDYLFDGANVQVGDIKVDIGSILRLRSNNLKRLYEEYNKLLYSVKMNTNDGYAIDTFVTGIINNTYNSSYVIYE